MLLVLAISFVIALLASVLILLTPAMSFLTASLILVSVLLTSLQLLNGGRSLNDSL